MIKAGDILFVHYAFNLFDRTTYMAPFIRGALSLDGSKMYYNHVAAVIDVDGVSMVVEAGFNNITQKAEVFSRTLEAWMVERKPKSYEVITPSNLDYKLFEERLLFAMGLPYDFANVLIHQPIKLFTRALKHEVWIGPVYPNKCQCSNLIAFALGLKKWHKYDPEELFIFLNKNQKEKMGEE